MKMTGAEIIVNTLIEQGVTDVFGYPGGQVLNIYDALYKNSDRINKIEAVKAISPVRPPLAIPAALSAAATVGLVPSILETMVVKAEPLKVLGNFA